MCVFRDWFNLQTFEIPQDNKTVFIELKNSGWRFFSEDGSITVETGLYFGNKNTFNENQNICISGISQKEDQEIKWEFNKIWKEK